LVGQLLPGCTRAWLSAVVTARRHPLGAGAQDFDGTRLGLVPLGLPDDGPDAVSWEGAADEDHKAATPRDAATAMGKRLDLELDLVARARTRAARGGGCRVRRQLVLRADRAPELRALLVERAPDPEPRELLARF